ncbi:BMC domain-containing protein [Desulforamulus aquiferis]|uniref:BMC domain-containing protein n=1 Tax=Desulforamulus aquiferis TaxID=1397668 RepID=A0AAW7ZDK9_9FIRM|nr:BMC domain-containing protein [Desulforamulus aquiferis]MDO7787817.1 BMC domain-containing protein [Desulforamulus aquiferis]RYD04004.1 propanediol utilization: polyhedral bodies pduT [Desulforamulus aquiferis]
MKRAIGLIETKNIIKGISVADAMLKSANVDLIMAHSVCPGKYFIMVGGDVGAVQNAVRSGKATGGNENIVDDIVLSNIHPDVFHALSGCSEVKEIKSLGVIESYSVASAILAADTAVKSATVQLIEVRLARGMGGKSLVTLSGEVGAVTAAVRAGSNAIQDSGFLIGDLVIAAPHQGLHKALF